MEQISLPPVSTMNIIAIFKQKCNLQELFVRLPVTDKIVSIRFRDEDGSNISRNEELSGSEQILLKYLEGMRQISPNYIQVELKIGRKHKSMKLYESKATILGCTSIAEGSEIIEEINNVIREPGYKFQLEIDQIYENLLSYKHKIKVDIAKVGNHFSQKKIFSVKQSEKSCTIKYKGSQFRIYPDRIIQTSKCINEAIEAFTVFIKELDA